jgi:type I restriction enzyme M protein
MTIVLPHGVLFRGGEEETIRKNLIENNKIDAIIGLPANIFFGTGIPTIIMVLKQNRKNDDILIIDASKEFIKVGKNNKLQASDIKRILDSYINRNNHNPKYARVVERAEIRKNNYNLNISRYVDSSEKSESWDLYATIFGGIPNHEIDEWSKYWAVFPNLKKSLFKSDGTPYSHLISHDINKTLCKSQEFKDFQNHFQAVFSDFPSFLADELIDGMDRVDRSKEEQRISENIFQRLQDIPLVDKYRAYQILDDFWKQIEIDLEIIQTKEKIVSPWSTPALQLEEG